MPTTIDVFAKVREFERAELLRAVRDADALPYFRELSGPAGPIVEMEGAERVMLGSNHYLGLTGDQRVKHGARDALERYGTGLTGSRLLNGTIPLHLELESELADWMGTDEALVFTTGHQANVGTLGTILAPGDTVVADSADHASILDGCLLSRAKLPPFRHRRGRAGRRGGRPGRAADHPLRRGARAARARAGQRALPARRPARPRAEGRRGLQRDRHAGRPGARRGRLEGRAAVEGAVRRRRLRQRRGAPGGPARRGASEDQRDGHARPRDPRSRPGLRGFREGVVRGRARS